MAVREIITLGNPILRQKARKIGRFDAGVQALANDLLATLHTVAGIGLAAPQVAQAVRLFVIDYDDKETGTHHKIVLANPEIVQTEGTQRGVDACLSIPGYYGVNVRRAARVVVKGQDVRGKPLRVSAEGLLAWALQHEIDHLDGILYIDRLARLEDLRPEQPADVEAAETVTG
jgi:peptide deformylase